MRRTPHKILYVLDNYMSHNRVGLDYCRLLKKFLPVRFALEHLLRPQHFEEAELIIYHRELSGPQTSDNFEAWRKMGKKIVTYSVWEADQLPLAYIKALRSSDEVWVPSQFCVDLYVSAGIDAVRLVPHLVEKPEGQLQSHDGIKVLVFPKLVDPRKNTAWLLTQINHVYDQSRELFDGVKFTFICRAGDEPEQNPVFEAFLKRFPESQLLWDVDFSKILGCYRETDMLLSMHHGEAWGLTLSEAMSHGVLVLASGWSGNLSFMNEGNSVLVPGELGPITERDASFCALWSSEMQWFYPDAHSFEQKLKACFLGFQEGAEWIKQKRAAARNLIDPFGSASISKILAARLADWSAKGWLTGYQPIEPSL